MQVRTIDARVAGWVALLVLLLMAVRAQAHDEVEVGAGTDLRLKVHHHINLPIQLPLSNLTGSPSFASADTGFHGVLTADPGHDLFPLAAGANVELVLVSADPDIHVLTGGGFLMPGQAMLLGATGFDSHLLFTLDLDAAFIAHAITFELRDLGGVHSSSAPFTLTFTPAPEPGSTGVTLIIGMVWGTRRRGRG